MARATRKKPTRRQPERSVQPYSEENAKLFAMTGFVSDDMTPPATVRLVVSRRAKGQLVATYTGHFLTPTGQRWTVFLQLTVDPDRKVYMTDRGMKVRFVSPPRGPA